jgi:hypothetical protein
MPQNPQRALYELLLDLFTPDELRRFLGTLPDGGSLLGALPGAAVTADHVVYEASDLLRRYGLIGARLFDELRRVRPLREVRIIEVARQFGIEPSKKAASPGVAHDTTTSRTTKTNILLLASNPSTSMLKLDQEARNIRNSLEASSHREHFDLQVRQAVRVDDLIPLLLKNPADLVHFSGHGSGADGLMFANIRDEEVFVEPDSLRRLFGVINDDARGGGEGREIRCVVLNACLSAPQALAIKEEVNCVIGMGKTVADDASIMYATALYTALAEGRSVATSFELARVNTGLGGLKDEGAPQLFERTAGIARVTKFGK